MYSWISVASGHGHTLVVRSDNTLWAWGVNTIGQLGDGTTIDKSSPTQVGSSNWSKVFAGGSHTAAITTTGSLYMWGRNTAGELGLNDVIARSSPTQVGSASWTVVALNKHIDPGYTLGIRNDGSLWAWGNNATYGGLGDGTTLSRSSPVQIGTSSWTSVSAAVSHSAAITTLGRLFAWGFNGSGELGVGDTAARSSPVQLSSPMSWTMVSVGGQFVASIPYGTTAAIRNDGLLFVCGQNANGQLGLSDSTNRSALTYLSSGSYSWSQITTVGFTMYGISSNNMQLFGWGYNESGQLGFNTPNTVTRISPVLVDSGSSFTVVTGGGGTNALYPSVFFVKQVNNISTLYGIGDDYLGHLGDGTTINKSSPVQIGTNLISDNKLSPNESIVSTFNVYESSPVQIGSGSWSIVEAGDQHTIGITSSNTLFAWGNNKFGQVGDSTTINRSSPVQIGSGTYSDASAGFNNNAVEKSDGTVYTFGSNDFGKLGDNT